jgi:hypothetical protein
LGLSLDQLPAKRQLPPLAKLGKTLASFPSQQRLNIPRHAILGDRSHLLDIILECSRDNSLVHLFELCKIIYPSCQDLVPTQSSSASSLGALTVGLRNNRFHSFLIPIAFILTWCNAQQICIVQAVRASSATKMLTNILQSDVWAVGLLSAQRSGLQ